MFKILFSENNQLDKNDTNDKNGTLPSVEPTIKVIEMTENATLPPSSRICENEECTLSGPWLYNILPFCDFLITNKKVYIYFNLFS